MKESEWFVVQDIDDFTDRARAIVYNNFGIWKDKSQLDIVIDNVKEQEQEDFDKILSHAESLVIVKESVKTERNRKTKKIRYILDENIFADIVHKLNDRMVSNILNSLVQKGLIETAFDDESNDFVFWCIDNENKNQEKPETD